MKVQPKVPGACPVDGATGPTEAEGSDKATGFAEALRGVGTKSVEGLEGAEVPGAVSSVVQRYAAGEITRTEAAREVAGATVDSWPPGTVDAAGRARAIEEIAEVLAEDPTFAALLDAAAGGTS